MSNPLFIKAPFLTRNLHRQHCKWGEEHKQNKQCFLSYIPFLSFATSDSSLGIKNSRYSINRLFLTSKELLV